MDMEKRLPDEQDKGQHNMKSEMVSPMPNKEPTMQSTQNWEPELRRIAVAWSHGDENYQTLVSFIRSVEEKSRQEWYEAGQKSRDQEVWEASSKLQ